MPISPELAARIRAGTGAPTTIDKILAQPGVSGQPTLGPAPAASVAQKGLLRRLLTSRLGLYGAAAGIGLNDDFASWMAEKTPFLEPARNYAQELGGGSYQEGPGLFGFFARRGEQDFTLPKDSPEYLAAYGRAPTAQAPTQGRDLSAILAALGGTGAGGSFNFSSPYFDFTPKPIESPAPPDYSRGAPVAPAFSQEDQFDSILQGIAAGGLQNTGSPIGDLLLAAGLGGLGGRAGYGREFRGKEEQFKREKATFEGTTERQRFSDQAALAEIQRANEALRLSGLEKQAAQLSPQISGSAAVVPQLVTRPDGTRVINYSVRQFPHAALQSRLQMMALLGGGGEAQVPAMFQSLLALDPSSAIDAAKAAGVLTLQGQGLSGKTLDEVTQAKILEEIKKKAPQLYQQIQARAQQQWLMKALGGK